LWPPLLILAISTDITTSWVSIAGGAQLAIGSRSECQDVPGLGGANGVWAQRGVTLVNAVPTLINIMTSLDDECRLPPLVRLLNLGGEACPPALVDRLWSPSLRIVNTYGPSETTVTATFKELVPGEVVTIGKPLPGYHALLLPVLDEIPTSWTPLEIKEGVEGELAIGGECIGKGYIGRTALTKEKFVNHPLPSATGERLYRTGDRVRLDRNLDIVFLGRIDAQVKHRGFRIELGEIEQSIAAHPDVQTAAVILSSATGRLEAYVVLKEAAVVEVRDIRAVLHHLPSYMQPEACFFLLAEELPRLPSGKINARALQDLSTLKSSAKQIDDEKNNMTVTVGSVLSTDSLAAGDSDTGVILKAMSEVFPQSERVTPSLDFFDDLGCHSLLAAQLVSKVRKESPAGSALKHLGLQDIYIHRTAEKIVSSLKEKFSEEKAEDVLMHKETQSSACRIDRWPTAQRRYILCALAQLPALFVLFFIEGLSLIGPYIVFYALLMVYGIGTAIGGAYFTFVAIPVLRAIIAIIGKWLVLSKAKAGEYPVYGVYYYRWWLAGQFIRLVDMVTIADTPILPAILRCLGARIGQGCHMGITYVGGAMDLVSIGDDVCLGKDIMLSTSWVERGRLILKEVQIQSQVNIDSHCVIEGGAIVEEGAELSPLSMVPDGVTIPMGERWVGSPARFHSQVQDVGAMRASRPSMVRALCMTCAVAMSSAFVLPILVVGPQIPSMMLFDFLNLPNIEQWSQTAIVIVPAAFAFLILSYVELLLIRWVVLGKVVERSYRTTSVYWYRKWLVGRMMDMSLNILHPIYATLYVVPFFRSLGVKIGRGAEVSTARGINFELTEIGAESFVADHVLLGNETVRNHTVTLKKTVLKDRAFVGNAALVHQGQVLASNTLVGVLSTTPEKSLQEGESCFGSPPILMPARQKTETQHAEHLLFRPKRKQVALRLFIEGMRIILPRLVITSALGFGTIILGHIYDHLDLLACFLLFPPFYLFSERIPSSGSTSKY
jgi:non-ribosomal peptide synthetase-like protein